MPIGSGIGCERPRHSAPVQPGLYVEVVSDVVRVVVIGKWMVVDRVIQEDCGNYQEEADCNYLAPWQGYPVDAEPQNLFLLVNANRCHWPSTQVANLSIAAIALEAGRPSACRPRYSQTRAVLAQWLPELRPCGHSAPRPAPAGDSSYPWVVSAQHASMPG